MKHSSFLALASFGLLLSSVVPAHSREVQVHSDQYVADVLGSELHPSSSFAQAEPTGSSSDQLASGSSAVAFAEEPVPFGEGTLSTSDSFLAKAENSNSPEMYENPFGLEIPAHQTQRMCHAGDSVGELEMPQKQRDV